MAFDGNDYRKRVLAAIEARGGVADSDPFEWYDLPLDGAKDRVVAQQLEDVWAFWQKQRDHPKYRGLVTALLAVHDELAPQLRDKRTRQQLAELARATREEGKQGAYAELDAAATRLVERFGGIPVSKLPGLRALAAHAGLDEESTERRLSRHRLVKDAAVSAAVPASVYRQVRADLDELGQLLGQEPPATLYDLLGLPPGASPPEVARERALASDRNRELRPDRRRALVDDLLAAVTAVLLEGSSAAYLDAVAEEVTAKLRPRVAAAILVEDVLTPTAHGRLLAEAKAAGLDPERAAQVLATLAREAGVAVPAAAPSRVRPERPRPVPPEAVHVLPQVTSLTVLPHGRRIRLVYAPLTDLPPEVRVEVRRLPEGLRPPVPGSVVEPVGERVPGMGPGLAVDTRPASPTCYLALTVGGNAVAGVHTWYADLPPISALRVEGDRLRWDWPAGTTEVMVVWRPDTPPASATDPMSQTRKVTNSRYDIDGGFAWNPEGAMHVAVFTCTRRESELLVACEAPVDARLSPP